MESMLSPVTVRHHVTVLPVYWRSAVSRGALRLHAQGATQVAHHVPQEERDKNEYDGHVC